MSLSRRHFLFGATAAVATSAEAGRFFNVAKCNGSGLLVATGGAPRCTVVSIDGDKFRINGELTYRGRSWRGHRIEGLLMNSRMVQAIFDDRNDETRGRCAYPDTKTWDEQ